MRPDTPIDFSVALRDILGHCDSEFTSLGYEDTKGVFHTEVVAPGQAVTRANELPDTNAYFGVNPTRGPTRKDAGRGREQDATRLAALWVDVDVKPGACPSVDVARAIIAELGIMLGSRPSIVVSSGGGMHAYWPISDGQIIDRDTAPRALLKRWHRLVAAVADRHNVSVDSVYDLARMMRVPGSRNHKTGEPRPVEAYLDAGGPLTMAEVAERLDEAGIPAQPDDTADASGEVIAAPANWSWAERTCPYVAAMIAGYATDAPTKVKGRNPWLLSQKVRLECAHRLGCISEPDYRGALSTLESRFTDIVRSTQWGDHPREPKKLEFRDTTRCAISKASKKTDEQALAELGNHSHPTVSGPTTQHVGGADPARFFDRDGLLAKDLADAVLDEITCGWCPTDHRMYVYTDGVWSPDDGTVEATIARFLGNRYRNSHARNILDLIRYSPRTARITCDPVPQFINVANGMLDWNSRTLLPHAAHHLSTVQLPVAYDSDADCPQFCDFIASVLPPDCYEPSDDSPGFIWELIGYLLYSGNPLHVAILLYGKGRNGKGTLIRVLRRLIGDRNCSTVGLHDLAENRFRAATLYGKLANLAGDLDSRFLVNTAQFKAITGGDSIQGEHKYGAVFDFTPWALPLYSTNRAFGAADSSEGWVARWIVVPFPMSFIGREDRNLDSRLQTDAELAGILRRAAQALPTLMARGRLPEPKSVLEAKRAFVTSSDAVRAWLDESCTLDPDQWTTRRALYDAYSLHAEQGGKRMSAREFYARVEQINGVRPVKRNGDRGFTGISLLSGQEGQEGHILLPPNATHGKKGDEAAPTAPHTPMPCPECGYSGVPEGQDMHWDCKRIVEQRASEVDW